MLVLPRRMASALPQTRDDVRVIRRHEVLQDLAAAGCRQAGGAQHVLDADGKAGEDPQRFPALAPGIDGSRCANALSSSTCKKARTFGSRSRMAFRNAVCEGFRSEVAAGQGSQQLGGRAFDHGAPGYSSTAGTP